MRKILIAITLASLGLSGCVKQEKVGNYLVNPLEVNQNKIAVDSVSRLIQIYPPAKTQLIISQKTTDNFGSSFVNELRKHGYSVAETYTENKKSNNENKNISKNNIGIPISYILDKFSDENYYRITINVGNQSISRLYENNNDIVIPAGYWVMKE